MMREPEVTIVINGQAYALDVMTDRKGKKYLKGVGGVFVCNANAIQDLLGGEYKKKPKPAEVKTIAVPEALKQRAQEQEQEEEGRLGSAFTRFFSE